MAVSLMRVCTFQPQGCHQNKDGFGLTQATIVPVITKRLLLKHKPKLRTHMKKYMQSICVRITSGQKSMRVYPKVSGLSNKKKNMRLQQ
jgi:hypothetical protein